MNGCKKHLCITKIHWIIAFLCIGILFVHPISVKVEDSQYLWHQNSNYNNPIMTSPDGFHLYAEPVEGLELVVFSESGVLKVLPETTEWKNRPSEYRITYEELLGLKPSEGGFLPPIVWYPRYDLVYDANNEVNEHNSETFCDYLGVIVKKDGFIVSSSLYKLTGRNTQWGGNVQELAVWEYPFLNCFVTEAYVKSELRKVILFDRMGIGTSEAPENGIPPYSPVYNP